MYASDTTIRELLDVLDISTTSEAPPFEPDDQIQPCSIDLRVDHVFWRPRHVRWQRVRRSHRVLDLRRHRFQEISPRRHWKRMVLKQGDTILLRPGQMVLARVCESFTMPDEWAGKIEGRSSYARLGLMVHCSGDFINPGWKGHMPLELVNFGKSTIRLVPYLPICQLKLVAVSSTPDRKYGDVDLGSKYLPDDGGPSYWWRDRLVARVIEQLADHEVSTNMSHEILDRIGEPDVGVLDRLERDISNERIGNYENVDSFLDQFAKREDLRRTWHRVWVGGVFLILTALIGTLLTLAVTSWPSSFPWVLVSATGIFAGLAVFAAIERDAGEFLGTRELRTLRQTHSR